MAETVETAAPAGAAAIEARGIQKSFGTIRALRGVDLTLAPGEVLGLVGDNAAGKSTLTKVLAGVHVPDAGTISVAGKPVRFTAPIDARNAGIEMVYQDLSLCDSIDVAGNLFLGREAKRRVLGIPFLAHRRMYDEAEAMLDRLHINVPNLRAEVAQLSGGQRQSIAIARAAAFEPPVLIMDEPTSALAVKEVDAVLDLIRRVSAKGSSVILITHRLQDLFRVCHRIMVMYEGRNVAERRIEDTDLGDLVDLIVGGKAAALSGAAQ